MEKCDKVWQNRDNPSLSRLTPWFLWCNSLEARGRQRHSVNGYSHTHAYSGAYTIIHLNATMCTAGPSVGYGASVHIVPTMNPVPKAPIIASIIKGI